MKIKGLTRVGLDFALAMGNANYAGNVRWAYEPRVHGRTFLVRLTSENCCGPGVKMYEPTRGSGKRRGPAVCWHAHRDFIRAVFDLNNEAYVKTAFAVYRSKYDFEGTYASTFDGSPCACEEK